MRSSRPSMYGRGEHGADAQVATPIQKDGRKKQEVKKTSPLHIAAPKLDSEQHHPGKAARSVQDEPQMTMCGHNWPKGDGALDLTVNMDHGCSRPNCGLKGVYLSMLEKRGIRSGAATLTTPSLMLFVCLYVLRINVVHKTLTYCLNCIFSQMSIF